MRWDYRRAILVDTKLLVVLVVGWVVPDKVGKIGRTDGYTIEDFDQLNGIVNQYRYVVTTPHVLTEASNFVFQGAKGELVEAIAAMMQRLYVLTDERFVTSPQAGARHIGATPRLGRWQRHRSCAMRSCCVDCRPQTLQRAH